MTLLPRMARIAQQLLLPQHCLLCLDKTSLDSSICAACLPELPWITNPCRGCAYPLKLERIEYCGKCLRTPPSHHRLISLFNYDDPIRPFITALKFQQQLHYAPLFAMLLAERVKQQYNKNNLPELIIPVPLHKKRIRQRGFNQALTIARPLAKRLAIPVNYRLIHRIRHTQAQSDLPAKLRPKNVKNAFSVEHAIRDYQHIALVDDVVTTGSTIKVIVDAIQQVNPMRVDVWTIARTLRG